MYRVPGLTVATDVICGFPTETDEVLGIHCLFYHSGFHSYILVLGCLLVK